MDKASAYEAGDCGFESRRRLPFDVVKPRQLFPGENAIADDALPRLVLQALAACLPAVSE
ncbi:hypothetical protein PC120_g28134 [Phytophthora cactorum]|nr:hypothetical protein PC120_g28134 [Phytophthora cactorum]